MKKAFVTVGLGFGDEGKGTIVDSAVRFYSSPLVVRYSGGYQAGHTACDEGKVHTFSQFGAGSLAPGRPATWLSEDVVINVGALRNEAKALAELTGDNPLSRLSVSPYALVATPSLVCVHQLQHMLRFGWSCGSGISNTREYMLAYGDDAVMAKDLRDRSALYRKLDRMRQRLRLQVANYVTDEVRVEFERASRTDNSIANKLLQVSAMFAESISYEMSRLMLPAEVKLADFHEATEQLMDDAVVVFEGAQGTLLDEYVGYHPYTTWSNVTADNAVKLVHQSSDDWSIHKVGVTRTYTTRHGAGPLPTQTSLLDGLQELSNRNDGPQGSFRRGWLDLPLLRRAATASDVDSIALTWCDVTEKLGADTVGYCDAYPANYSAEPQPLLNHTEPEGWPSLALSARATQNLMELQRGGLPDIQQATIAQLVEILDQSAAPVTIMSYGREHTDKQWLSDVMS